MKSRQRGLHFEQFESRTLLAANVVAPLPGFVEGAYCLADGAQSPVVDATLDAAYPGAEARQMQGHQVQRPFRVRADIESRLYPLEATVEGNYILVPWEIEKGFGNATHAGRITLEGTGHVYINPSDGSFVKSIGSGSTTAANGDVISWESEELPNPDGSISGKITFTSGTGRFLDVEGWFNFDYTPDPGQTDIFAYSMVGNGKITY